MKTSFTSFSKRVFILFVLVAHQIICQTTGKIVPWTYNPANNPGFNTSAYEAWAYQRKIDWTTQTLPFRMLKPVGYNTSGPGYPLVVMLHGRGERGTDNNYHLLWGGQIHQQAVQSGAFPGFVVFPQEPFGAWTNGPDFTAGQQSTALSQVFDLIDSLVLKYKIDPDRIYVHGLSSGGTGTWASMYHRPDLFAAGLPMSAPGDQSQVSKIAPTPIWLFQGSDDTNPIAAVSRAMISALRGAGAIDATLTKYTEYPGVGHFTWNLAYTDPDFFPYMLRQNKKNLRLLGANPIPSGGTSALGISAGMGAYQWYKDGNPIAGATGHRLDGISQPGSYYVLFKRKPSSPTWVTSTTIVLTGSASNLAPTASITAPLGGAAFVSPANITITANASDVDGTITKVEFYANGSKIGEKITSPYTFAWNGVVAGTYALQVKATDNLGASSSSSVVNIVVNTPTNNLPTVSITSPANNSSFTAPASITISANAFDDGSIKRVEFYDGGTLLGSDLTSPYSFTWNSVPVGNHSLTAVAVDNLDASATSTVVSVQVTNTGGTLGTGLTGTYFNNINLTAPSVLKRNDATINFSWGVGSPLNGVVNTNNFSARWTGKILAPATGTYSFSVQGDDGVRLRVNNTFIINNFNYKNSTDVGTISLTAGQFYDITLEYFEGGGDATIIMRWSYPGQALVVVPQGNLYPSEILPAARVDMDAVTDTQVDYNLAMYPNPASEVLNFNVSALTEEVVISIKGITGTKTSVEKAFSNAIGEINVPLNELENGLYLVSITHDGYTIKEKLVIHKVE